MEPVTSNPSLLLSSNKKTKINDHNPNVNKFERETVKNFSNDKKYDQILFLDYNLLIKKI